MATKRNYKKSKRTKTMKRSKKGGQEKPKKRSFMTSVGVGITNLGLQSAAIGARIVFRTAVSQAVKSKAISPEVGDNLNAIFDKGTKGATNAIKYGTSVKAQEDFKYATENPGKILQKGKEQLSSAASTAMNSEQFKKARSFVGNKLNQGINQGNTSINSKEIAPKIGVENQILPKANVPDYYTNEQGQKQYNRFQNGVEKFKETGQSLTSGIKDERLRNFSSKFVDTGSSLLSSFGNSANKYLNDPKYEDKRQSLKRGIQNFSQKGKSIFGSFTGKTSSGGKIYTKRQRR